MAKPAPLSSSEPIRQTGSRCMLPRAARSNSFLTAEKKDYAAKKKALEEQFSQMHTDVHMIKQDFERQQVGVRTLDEMTTQEVLQEASRIQDKDLGALERMKQQIAQTGEVAAATATRLKGQTDQLKNIDTDVMKVKSNLARADLLVRAFMRKMMTDKIVMVFMCLIFCGRHTHIHYIHTYMHTT